MKLDKNIIKGNKFHETTGKKVPRLYAIIEVKVKDQKGNTSVKSFVEEFEGERLFAKSHFETVAKEYGGNVVYVGGFRN